MLDSSAVATVLVNAAGRVIYASRAARRLFADGRPLDGATLGRGRRTGAAEPLRQALLGGGDALVTTAVAGADETFYVARRSFELNARRHTLLPLEQLTPELRRQEVALWKKVIRIIGHELSNSLAPIRSLVHSARDHPPGAGTRRARRDPRHHRRQRGSHLTASSTATRASRGCRRRGVRRSTSAPSWSNCVASSRSPVAGSAARRAAAFDDAQMSRRRQPAEERRRGRRPSADDRPVTRAESAEAWPRGARPGPGMDAEVMANALLPFYSSKTEGSGLGLALCREIVEAHGGTLDAGNRDDGTGAVVRFWLPPAPEAPAYRLRGSLAEDSTHTP